MPDNTETKENYSNNTNEQINNNNDLNESVNRIIINVK
jgi:hypothetical protein